MKELHDAPDGTVELDRGAGTEVVAGDHSGGTVQAIIRTPKSRQNWVPLIYQRFKALLIALIATGLLGFATPAWAGLPQGNAVATCGDPARRPALQPAGHP